MGRRRKDSPDGGVNLDSLMDALTNVVAVLILVLILVQADVSKKVVQFMEGLKPATPEQVANAGKKLASLQAKSKRLDSFLSQETPKPEEIDAEKRQLALLEKDVKKRDDLLAKLDQLKKLADKIRSQRDAEAKKTSEIQKEIARLEELLDQTPVLKIEPTVVRIPASRPVPKKAKIYYALVINDRVHFIDPFTPVELFEREFKRRKTKFPFKRIKQKGTDRFIYDPKPIIDHFKDFDFKNSRNQKHRLFAWPTATRLTLGINPDLKNGGTSLEELKKPQNQFASIVGRLRLKNDAVLIFWVHPNSFNTYLLARRVTDKAKLPAGWEVRGAGDYKITIPNIEIQRQKEPDPPNPDAPPPRRPPKLPTKID
jgi:hypothetical protein